jgi:hypothetical protein
VRIGSLLVVVWLVIGVLAAAQRGYLKDADSSCAKASTTAVTIVAGPLNYLGVNPKAKCPSVDVNVKVPQPSK